MDLKPQVKSVEGVIHSFESCGTVDGPGIRFVVFLQGCNLRCKYCHNPDTWDLEGGDLYTAKDVISKAARYKPFMDSSGGGMTISGGEPLLQVDFLVELIDRAHEKGISVAIDTAGCVDDLKSLIPVLEKADLLLLDIKATTVDQFKYIAGGSYAKFMGFVKLVNNYSIKLQVRYVLVPTINDSEEELIELGKLLSSINNIVKFEFLQFHKLGEYKWETLDYNYQFSHIEQATDEDEKRAIDIVNEFYPLK